MADKLKPFSKEWYARQRRHQHNSFTGHVAMCKANMNSIICSETATQKAKALAIKIHNLADELGFALKVRKDAPPQA